MGESERGEVLRRFRSELKSDSARQTEREGHFDEIKQIIDELRELGYDVDSLDDVRHLGRPWKTALPVLLKWLPKLQDPKAKESIVRSLSVPWIGNRATGELIAEFKSFAHALPLFGWTIGNALSLVDIVGFESEILDLASQSRYGMARQMIVMGLWRIKDPVAEKTALALLTDEDVKVHAIMALGKMKSRRALTDLEKLSTDKNAAVRRESRKAIKNITRL